MPSVLAMTKDLILAQIRVGHLSPDAMQTALYETHAYLLTLQAHEAGRSLRQVEEPVAPAPVHWKHSITKHAIICLVCGASFRQLSGSHLRAHALDAQAYRVRYGIPRRQPLAAKTLRRQRQDRIQQARPWEQTSTYRHAQARKAATAARSTPARRPRTRSPCKAGS
jgi:predicted transcriptional regulator